MKWEVAKKNVHVACGHWGFKQEANTPESMKKSNYMWAFCSCGTIATRKDGSTFPKKCKSVLCAECSQSYSESQARSLISAVQHAVKSEFCHITMMICITRNISEMYSLYDEFRKRLRYQLDKKRRSRKSSLSNWKDLGLVGCLEVDVFSEKDFGLLGDKKQKQLIEKLNYIHTENSTDSIWTLHVHCCAYVGSLSEVDLAETLEKVARSVHMEPLKPNLSVQQNVYGILGYANKVNFQRELPNSQLIFWTKEQVEHYANAVLSGDGNKSHKFSMLPVGNLERKRVAKKSLYYIGEDQ